MSNAVYPVLPGLAFGVQRTPLAPATTVLTTPSEREFRARSATLPRYQYTLVYEFLRANAAAPHLQTLVGFFNSRGGAFDSFRFNDPDDNATTAQPFGTGNSSMLAWQLVRSFGGFAEPVFEINSTTRAPAIYVDGVLKTVGTHYSISATGVVTFTTAPSTGAVLTWTGDYYRRVRFLRDQLDTTKFMADLWEARKVELLSTKT